MLVEDGLAQAARDDVDQLLAVQEAGEIGVVEDARPAGQAEAGAGDHDRLTLASRRARAAVVDRAGAVEEVGEEMAELR